MYFFPSHIHIDANPIGGGDVTSDDSGNREYSSHAAIEELTGHFQHLGVSDEEAYPDSNDSASENQSDNEQQQEAEEASSAQTESDPEYVPSTESESETDSEYKYEPGSDSD
jgi:hypothetical protein